MQAGTNHPEGFAAQNRQGIISSFSVFKRLKLILVVSVSIVLILISLSRSSSLGDHGPSRYLLEIQQKLKFIPTSVEHNLDSTDLRPGLFGGEINSYPRVGFNTPIRRKIGLRVLTLMPCLPNITEYTSATEKASAAGTSKTEDNDYRLSLRGYLTRNGNPVNFVGSHRIGSMVDNDVEAPEAGYSIHNSQDLMTRARIAVQKYKPNVVVIDAGVAATDALKASAAELPEFYRRFDALVQAIIAANAASSSGIVVLISTVPVPEASSPMPKVSDIAPDKTWSHLKGDVTGNADSNLQKEAPAGGNAKGQNQNGSKQKRDAQKDKDEKKQPAQRSPVEIIHDVNQQIRRLAKIYMDMPMRVILVDCAGPDGLPPSTVRLQSPTHDDMAYIRLTATGNEMMATCIFHGVLEADSRGLLTAGPEKVPSLFLDGNKERANTPAFQKEVEELRKRKIKDQEEKATSKKMEQILRRSWAGRMDRLVG